MDDTASSNASITELPEFGQRTLKNGSSWSILSQSSILHSSSKKYSHMCELWRQHPPHGCRERGPRWLADLRGQETALVW
jgi:hypothetical protein